MFWSIPAQGRAGHVLVSGVHVGAGHAALKGVVEEAEGAKVKRSMYAETERERVSVLGAVRSCEWNAEMDPVVVLVSLGGEGALVEHDFACG